MKYLFIILFTVSFFPAFAENNEIELVNPTTYELEIDDHKFNILYQVNSDVLAMAIDNELNSLLIGLKNSDDSMMVVQLDKKLINATNNEFAILVNGHEVNYDIHVDSNTSTLRFFVPAFTEEVEIIGTHVIPEFPFAAMLLLSLIIPITLGISRKFSLFRL